MTTRKEIRRDIGFNLSGTNEGAMRVYQVGANSTASVLFGTGLRGGDVSHFGKWVVVNGQVRSVIKGDTEDALTLDSPLSAAPAVTDDFELWDQRYQPDAVHSIIKQAIQTAEEHLVYHQITNRRWYAEPGARRVDTPPGFAAINGIELQLYAAGYWEGIDLWTEITGLTGAVVDNTTFGFQTIELPAGAHTFEAPNGYAIGLYDKFGLEFRSRATGYMAPLSTSPAAEREAFDPGWVYRDILHDGLGGEDFTFYLSQPVHAIRATFHQERAIQWQRLDGWSIWRGRHQIELHAELSRAEGVRMRIFGGEKLNLPTTDDDDVPLETYTNYIRASALVPLLRRLGRGQQDAVVSREWEQTAASELASLPRMQNAYLID